jgi:hypothetical protein
MQLASLEIFQGRPLRVPSVGSHERRLRVDRYVAGDRRLGSKGAPPTRCGFDIANVNEANTFGDQPICESGRKS